MTGGGFEFDNADFDSQDQAEVFDETNSTDGGDMGEVRSYADSDRATAEEKDQVLDLTQLIGDRDDDEAVALDADEFDPDAVDDADLEEDDETNARAATAEREDDLDGQGPEDAFDEARIALDEIEGLEIVRDADDAEGGEDDTTDFQAQDVSDAELKQLGYSEARDGQVLAKP